MKFQMIAAALLITGSSVAYAQQAENEQEATATATTAAQTEEAEAEEEDDEGQEVVCRTSRVTGSLTRRRRTCMTRNEWAAAERNTQSGLNQMGRSASGGQCIPDNPTTGSC